MKIEQHCVGLYNHAIELMIDLVLAVFDFDKKSLLHSLYNLQMLSTFEL